MVLPRPSGHDLALQPAWSVPWGSPITASPPTEGTDTAVIAARAVWLVKQP